MVFQTIMLHVILSETHYFLDLFHTTKVHSDKTNLSQTALLSVVESLRLARGYSKSSIIILLDLSAAFDTVNHQILL